MKTEADPPDGIDDFIRLAGRPIPRPRTAVQQARSTARIVKLGATPVAVVLVLAWLKKLGFASLVGTAVFSAALGDDGRVPRTSLAEREIAASRAHICCADK